MTNRSRDETPTQPVLTPARLTRCRLALCHEVRGRGPLAACPHTESTTGSIPFFLHTSFELDPARFYRAVSPNWKVGLRFERWGSEATNSFNSSGWGTPEKRATGRAPQSEDLILDFGLPSFGSDRFQGHHTDLRLQLAVEIEFRSH